MKTSVFLLIILVSFQAVLANPETILSNDNLPPEFEAIYDVQKKGLRVGSMVVSLNKNGNKIIYKSVVNSVGIASLLADEKQLTDRAILELIDDSYRALEFTHTVVGGAKDRNEHYSFDWEDNKVSIRYKDRISSLNIPFNTYDNFSVQLLLMREPDDNNIENTYSVISKGRLKNYVYKFESLEEIKTSLGKLNANKYVRKKNNDKRTTYFGWYAENLHYIPVRLDKFENGKIDLSIQITNVTWL